MIQLVIFPLEKIDTRYTGQWFSELPNSIRRYCIKNKIDLDLINLEGDIIESNTTPGAFLNFLSTNIYKNTQVNKFFNLINQGVIQKGCKVLFPDAWHTGIIQCKYVSDLMGLDLEIFSIYHAGSYDPQDFLGRLVEDKRWSYNAERSFYYCCKKSFFATKFHIDLFWKELINYTYSSFVESIVVRAGLPFDYLKNELEAYKELPKRDLILFPHRIAPEKQVEIFRDLAKELPEYEFIVCQDKTLTKHEYHTLLGQSKIVFSANLQETLGISCYEGLLCNSIPLMPDRLSYSEIYNEDFLYPSEYTSSWENYIENKESLKTHIRCTMNAYNYLKTRKIQLQIDECQNFFSCEKMLKNIFE